MKGPLHLLIGFSHTGFLVLSSPFTAPVLPMIVYGRFYYQLLVLPCATSAALRHPPLPLTHQPLAHRVPRQALWNGSPEHSLGVVLAGSSGASARSRGEGLARGAHTIS
jgi:hypothetical protein